MSPPPLLNKTLSTEFRFPVCHSLSVCSFLPNQMLPQSKPGYYNFHAFCLFVLLLFVVLRIEPRVIHIYASSLPLSCTPTFPYILNALLVFMCIPLTTYHLPYFCMFSVFIYHCICVCQHIFLFFHLTWFYEIFPHFLFPEVLQLTASSDDCTTPPCVFPASHGLAVFLLS